MKNIKWLLIILFSLFILTSCNQGTNNNSAPQLDFAKAFDEATADTPSILYEGEKLNLPSELLGYEVSYSFDKADFFDQNYQVIKGDEFSNKQVTLNISVNGTTFSRTYLVHQSMEGYFAKVFDFLGGYIPGGVVSKDLNLKTTYLKDDITITYESNHPEFVTDDGKRIDHEYDEDICLSCTVTKHGFTETKQFTFVSQGISYEERLNRSISYIDEFLNNNELTDGLVLPTELPNFGGRFRWVAEDPTVIYDYKTLHLPRNAEDTHLMVEIYFTASAYKVLKYPVHLNETTVSFEDYCREFISTTLELDSDYLITYQGLAPVINTTYLVDSKQESKILLRKVFYQDGRPAVSQARLDKIVYPGYTLNNPDNVLWIVTHETGMSYAGDDALLLGKSQYANAYSENGSDRASWNYTVDDHSIYQSYADSVACWHATDGRTEGGGNYNGIGIELCVNADGNFEVAMRNDARLMASLLLKHNLGILNMKQHHDFYEPKDCPFNIRRDVRWFEYLKMISCEYISQLYLKDFSITYDLAYESEAIEGIYNLTDVASGTKILITIHINELVFTKEITK